VDFAFLDNSDPEPYGENVREQITEVNFTDG